MTKKTKTVVGTKPLKIGLVGATGMVGQTFVKILNNSNIKINELRAFASDASKGKQLSCQGASWQVQTLHDGCFKGLDLVFFTVLVRHYDLRDLMCRPMLLKKIISKDFQVRWLPALWPLPYWRFMKCSWKRREIQDC